MKIKSKTLLIVVGVVSLLSAHVFAQSSKEVGKWTSPDGTSVLSLRATNFKPDLPPIISVFAEGNQQSIAVTEPSFINSRIRREYAGTSWLLDSAPRWVDNRYAIFEHQGQSLCIIDAKAGTMLLDTVFEALTDGPSTSGWAAIRYRPLARTQKRLKGEENDTLLVINIHTMVSALGASSGNQMKPFGHLKAIALPGVALASPIWKTGGKEVILVAVWNWNANRAEALSFSSSTLELINRATINLAIPESVIYSPWIDRAFESKVSDALNSSGL